MTEDEANLYGGLTAFQFMIENLFATVINMGGGNAATAIAMRDEMLRQFEDLPTRNETPSDEGWFMVQQHALARLERMWAAIEDRLSQGPQT